MNNEELCKQCGFTILLEGHCLYPEDRGVSGRVKLLPPIDMNFMDKYVLPILKETYEITLRFYGGEWSVSLFASNLPFIDVDIAGIDDLTEVLRQAIEKVWETENASLGNRK